MKNNIKFALIALTVVIATLAISCKKDDPPKLDFDIAVPSDWLGIVHANQGMVYSAVRQPAHAEDSVREGLYIFKESLPDYNLNTYYEAIKELILKSDDYDSLIYESDTVINSTSFKKLISREIMDYTSPEYPEVLDLPFITERFFFFEKNHGYNMAFLSAETAYPQKKLVFEAIMNSFHYKY